jgi:hypothetical protein
MAKIIEVEYVASFLLLFICCSLLRKKGNRDAVNAIVWYRCIVFTFINLLQSVEEEETLTPEQRAIKNVGKQVSFEEFVFPHDFYLLQSLICSHGFHLP